MGIIGDHPEGGLRFDLERMTSSPPWVYTGTLATPGERHALHITVDASGAVVVHDESMLPGDMAQRTKMLVRTVVKHATDGRPPPQRIRRWRAG
jgi:hypothetical protein